MFQIDHVYDAKANIHAFFVRPEKSPKFESFRTWLESHTMSHYYSEFLRDDGFILKDPESTDALLREWADDIRGPELRKIDLKEFRDLLAPVDPIESEFSEILREEIDKEIVKELRASMAESPKE